MRTRPLIGIALTLILGLAGCAGPSTPTAPTSTPLPTVAVPLPAVPPGGFNLTTTLTSATGPQSCAVNISHMHVGDSYDAWLLTIARSGASINLVVSDRRNPTERYEYEGTVVGNVFTAEIENYSVGAGWCGGRVTFTNESHLSGRFSEDGRTLAAEVVDSIRLDSSGEEIELHFDWAAVEQ